MPQTAANNNKRLAGRNIVLSARSTKSRRADYRRFRRQATARAAIAAATSGNAPGSGTGATVAAATAPMVGPANIGPASPEGSKATIAPAPMINGPSATDAELVQHRVPDSTTVPPW